MGLLKYAAGQLHHSKRVSAGIVAQIQARCNGSSRQRGHMTWQFRTKPRSGGDSTQFEVVGLNGCENRRQLPKGAGVLRFHVRSRHATRGAGQSHGKITASLKYQQFALDLVALCRRFQRTREPLHCEDLEHNALIDLELGLGRPGSSRIASMGCLWFGHGFFHARNHCPVRDRGVPAGLMMCCCGSSFLFRSLQYIDDKNLFAKTCKR